MSSCSKAAQGLFVLLRTAGIFTGNALSPSSSLRQCPYHYSIRAGQNLPDKEFRYLRTVIVTAAVHWGFSSDRKAFPLTFQHWAGVSPYTSTFVLAETCVFGKQLHGRLSCGLATISIISRVSMLAFFYLISDMSSQLFLVAYREINPIGLTNIFVFKRKLTTTTITNIVARQTLFRSYGRCIAEFLNEESLVHLGLLDLSTCVGLRYGQLYT